MVGDLAPTLWGRKEFHGGPNFWMTFLGNISIFYRHRPNFYGILHVNLILCNIYDPILAEKPLFQNKTFLHNTFFSQFVLCNASDNTFLSKYWGDGCMGRPPPQILEGTSPRPPTSPPMTVTRPITDWISQYVVLNGYLYDAFHTRLFRGALSVTGMYM